MHGSDAATQADLDASAYQNTANASSADPANRSVSALPASVTVPATQTPHLMLTKGADRISYSQVGDVINYTLAATTTGTSH